MLLSIGCMVCFVTMFCCGCAIIIVLLALLIFCVRWFLVCIVLFVCALFVLFCRCVCVLALWVNRCCYYKLCLLFDCIAGMMLIWCLWFGCLGFVLFVDVL